MKAIHVTERLEDRIAPAFAFPSGFVATFTDVDGDFVTIRASKPIFDDADFTRVPAGLGEQLLSMNLADDGPAADRLNLTITAVPKDVNDDGSKDGDGRVNIGWIDATGIDLGAVKVPGDLGRIIAGDATLTTTGVASLTLASLGRFGTALGAPDLKTDIMGKLGSLRISGDGASGADVHASAMGAITVGGSLLGFIDSDGDIGAVKVAGDTGAMLAAGKIASATVGGRAGGFFSNGSIGMVKVGGDLGGGLSCATLASLDVKGSTSGSILIDGDAGFIKIRGSSFSTISSENGNLAGVRIGGDFGSYSIRAERGKIGSVQIGGNLEQANIKSGGDIGSIRIAGSVLGFTIDELGRIDCGGKLGSVTIGGSLIGSGGAFNTVTDADGVLHEGQIFAVGPIGRVVIGGDVAGGEGAASGQIRSHTSIGSVVVGGSLLGFASSVVGEGVATGQIASAGDIGSVKIGGDMLAGAGEFSGRIDAGGKLGRVTIGGDVGQAAGTGSENTAGILSGGDMGIVNIGGGVSGFLGSSGEIVSLGDIQSITIGGSLRGGSLGSGSGQIVATGELGRVTIGGDLSGGIAFDALDRSGYIEGARIGSVFIGGSIVTGQDLSNTGDATRNASIRAVNDIGSITVMGSLIGNGDANDDDSTPVIISARGKTSMPATNDVAIGRITVHGSVELTNILAGYDTEFGAVNADAQVGSVTVHGDWISSNLLVGVQENGDGFGNSNDTKITGAGVKDAADRNGRGAVSKIASVIIKGQAIGHFGSTPAFYTFGIEAQQLGVIRVGGATVPLLAGAGNDLMAPGNAVGKARPLGSTFGTTISDGFDFHAFEVPLT